MNKLLYILLLLFCSGLYAQEFTYDKFGVKTKTAVYEKNIDGSITKYKIEDFALKTKVKTYKKDIQGNIEVYEYDKFGIKQKTKEIKTDERNRDTKFKRKSC